MAETRNEKINSDDGWVSIATSPQSLSITANSKGIWYVVITETGTPAADVYGERMGDYDSYVTGDFTGTLYVRATTKSDIRFGITEG